MMTRVFEGFLSIIDIGKKLKQIYTRHGEYIKVI